MGWPPKLVGAWVPEAGGRWRWKWKLQHWAMRVVGPTWICLGGEETDGVEGVETVIIQAKWEEAERVVKKVRPILEACVVGVPGVAAQGVIGHPRRLCLRVRLSHHEHRCSGQDQELLALTAVR